MIDIIMKASNHKGDAYLFRELAEKILAAQEKAGMLPPPLIRPTMKLRKDKSGRTILDDPGQPILCEWETEEPKEKE